jgi:hypothetical protein
MEVESPATRSARVIAVPMKIPVHEDADIASGY